MYQYENKIIQKNRGFIAYSAIKMPNKSPRRNSLRTAAKLSPMIGKSFLGESLNFLIGKLKLSYRRIFPIIGESFNNPYPCTTEKRPIFDKVRKSRAFIS